MDDIIIRIATEADADAVSALTARLADFELPRWRTAQEIVTADTRATLAALSRGGVDEQVLIAERGGEPAGCLHVLLAEDFFGRAHAHVSVIATSRSAEGTGVGRALMARAEAWARAKGVSLLTLNVFARNTRARTFYERGGFEAELIKYAKPID